MAMLNNQMVNHPFFPLNSMKNHHFHGVFFLPMTSPFHGAALQQLRSKVLAPGATTGHALVAVLGAGTLERGLGQSLERGLPWSIIWVLGEWDIYIYIYIRLIIWGSSILPVIWGTRIWSSNQWWWFMGELWENFQNYGTGNGIMEW